MSTNIPESLHATTQHLELLREKRAYLAQVMLAAEGQYLLAIRREWVAGNLTWPQLLEIHKHLRTFELPGSFPTRWMEVMGIHRAEIVHQAARAANGVDGSWHGTWPLRNGEPYPLKGHNVVYVLFDDQRIPVYVGSSGHWNERMKQHVRAGKQWTSWLAHPCRDREAAYAAEAEFLRQFMPELNIQGPTTRSSVAA